MNDDNFDLDHLLNVMSRRRWVIAASTLLSLVVAMAALFAQPPVYRANALVHIERERDTAVLSQNSNLVERSKDDFYQTQYRLLTSYSLVERLHAALRLESDLEFGNPDGVLKLQSGISVKPVMGTRLVYVNADSLSPKRAMDVANALADLFVQQNLENQLFISHEILRALQTGAGADRKAYEMLPAVVNNKLIQELKTQEAMLQAQIADFSQRYTEKHPSVLSLTTQLDLLQSRRNEEIDKAVASLKTELSGQLKGNNARVVDRARLPRAPVKPNKLFYRLGGLVLGLALGLAFAFLLEMLDQTIRTQEHVEQKLNVPFLALIPFSKIPKNAGPFADMLAPTPSLSSEAFRNMRTMVDFAHMSAAHAPLLVTSTVQEEGKSHVSSNLAVAYAQMHPRVLLIDGDLRRPSLHRKFQISSEKGLSNFLASGENAEELAGLLQDTVAPGLKLLPCGPRPPNPSELLNTPRVAAVLAWAAGHFDRVIIDTPPIFPISDTILWGRHVKHAAFVVRFGKTRIPLVKNAAKRLEISGIKALGVVVNGASEGGLAYAHYGGYNYQYYRAYTEEGVSS